ncbi:hypothetical protein EXIGLDRAFT_763905 [Exidia glandulosa HHB12029]|uniref:F-box domain-containing protein n=1 Tax=Exidia glandulosa HHB12029 TaxID=1314781 RepID=A0A165LM28_EXIGL|nr:hypothetical protein EXIGLDRAFT_763905 [Exidia glandulosa HHB12029]
MRALSTLPPELLLLIAEHAAASEARRHLGSIASLSRVCKSLHRAVTPILYAHMVVTQHNLHLLAQLALESAYLFVSVCSATFSGLLGTHRRDDKLQAITRAMTNLRAVTGRIYTLRIVLDASDDLCPSSIFVTGLTESLSSGSPRFLRYLHTVTRLHIAVTLRHSHVGVPQEMKTEYLILDVLNDGFEDDSTWSLYTCDVLQRVEDIINSLPSLRRILIRTRTLITFDMTPFHIATEKWAKTKRDPRIWIDDSATAPWLGGTAFETMNLEDAAAGDELWLTGRQIYSQ